MNKFLNQFGTRKFKTTRGYSAEWVAKRLKEDDKNTTTDILKVWSHQSRRAECSRERVQELNKMTDDIRGQYLGHHLVSVRGHSEASQNTLDYSSRGILSKIIE